MGGSVAIGVRFSSGKIDCYSGWTSDISQLKIREIIVDRSESIFLHIMKELRNDEHSQSFLAPEGYGLFFIDFKDGHILSMQGYTDFGSFMDYDLTESDRRPPHDRRQENFIDLVLAGRVMSVRRDIVPIDNLEVEFSSLINGQEEIEAIIKIIKEQKPLKTEEQSTWFHFPIIFEPTMTYIDFGDHGTKPSIAFLEKLKEIGVPINDESQALWDVWIKEASDDE